VARLPESRETVSTQTDNRRKHLEILKNMYSGDRVRIEMAHRALNMIEEEEREAFDQFQRDVGNVFIEVKEELDQTLEDLADDCPDEPDPRKWNAADWAVFELAINGHRFENILRTYAAGLPNIDLIWKEIDQRIDLG
jgi:hypothetical protein